MHPEATFKFEELRVYQDSLLFIDEIYTTTNSFPRSELFGLISQLQRAAVSVALNIAEGSSRTRKDFQHFLVISRGSCFECAAILQIVYKRRYISETSYQSLFTKTSILARMITALKNSL